MIIIKADTLEIAMSEASEKFECSVTELHIEVVEYPKNGLMGLFKKQAVIAVVKKGQATSSVNTPASNQELPVSSSPKPKTEPKRENKPFDKKPQKKTSVKLSERSEKVETQSFASNSDDLVPSLVTAQDDYVYDENEYKKSKAPVTAKRTKEDIQRGIAKAEEESSSIKRVSKERFKESAVVDTFFNAPLDMEDVIKNIHGSINKLFSKTCFTLDAVEVSVFDENTVLIEFTGADAALLIGKEGYRYKALSYMLFNWINAKYGVQLRLEIAEFLKNQEEMVHKYLEGVSDQVQNNGRAQTKILDGVLVQIALKKLRATFPDKYVAIRTNRDGLKYIIVNSFRSNNG